MMALKSYQIKDVFREELGFSLGFKYLGLSIKYTSVPWKTNEVTRTLKEDLNQETAFYYLTGESQYGSHTS